MKDTCKEKGWTREIERERESHMGRIVYFTASVHTLMCVALCLILFLVCFLSFYRHKSQKNCPFLLFLEASNNPMDSFVFIFHPADLKDSIFRFYFQTLLTFQVT